MRRRLAIFSVIGATLAALAVGGIGVLSASAQGGNEDNITICHRRASETNPYGPQAITVDANAINNPNGHAFHEGPIFPDVGPDGFWGDIIPPFGDLTPPDGFPGLNFTAQGQAILENNCQIPGLVTTTTGPTVTTAAPPVTTAPPSAAVPAAPAAAAAVAAVPRVTG